MKFQVEYYEATTRPGGGFSIPLFEQPLKTEEVDAIEKINGIKGGPPNVVDVDGCEGVAVVEEWSMPNKITHPEADGYFTGLPTAIVKVGVLFDHGELKRWMIDEGENHE